MSTPVEHEDDLAAASSPAAAEYHPWLHRLAIVMCGTALLPILLGAQTTTEGAGMAFPDYPTSDGEGMFTYNLFEATWHQFLEHSHRLAGTLIGFVTMIFCGSALVLEDRKLVKRLAICCLLAVIAQGLLGGIRVLRVSTEMAMVHGFTAALTLGLMAVTACTLSKRWFENDGVAGPLNGAKTTVVVVALMLCTQYLLGGVLRHFGYIPEFHMGFAFVVWIGVVVAWVVTMLSRNAWIQKSATTLNFLLLAQLGLGVAAWICKYGTRSTPANIGSPAQLWTRSAHMLLGTLIIATMAVLIVRVWRASCSGQAVASTEPSMASEAAPALEGQPA